MGQPQTIDEETRVEVYRLFREAADAAATGDLAATERLSNQAWALIPEPKFCWDVTYVCVAGMVKRLRRCGRHEQAIAIVNDYLLSEYHVDYHDGPYFWLGTLHYEKGDMAAAHKHFDRANRISRGRCFVEEDPKYKQFFRAWKNLSKPN